MRRMRRGTGEEEEAEMYGEGGTRIWLPGGAGWSGRGTACGGREDALYCAAYGAFTLSARMVGSAQECAGAAERAVRGRPRLPEQGPAPHTKESDQGARADTGGGSPNGGRQALEEPWPGRGEGDAADGGPGGRRA